MTLSSGDDWLIRTATGKLWTRSTFELEVFSFVANFPMAKDLGAEPRQDVAKNSGPRNRLPNDATDRLERGTWCVAFGMARHDEHFHLDIWIPLMDVLFDQLFFSHLIM